jgi:8-oxo-dGTP diphosphatase
MPSIDPKKPLEVAVGVLQGPDGRVLLAQRRQGVHLEHLWEFPGGKLEPGETARVALTRELEEELGIRILKARQHLLIPYAYPTVRVLLHVFRVDEWAGEVRSMEGQPLIWTPVSGLDDWSTPPASRAIIHALKLPTQYWITPDPGVSNAVDGVVQAIENRLLQGDVRLLQIRAPSLDVQTFARFVDAVVAIAKRLDVQCLVNSTQALPSLPVGVGLHLTERSLQALRVRPACSGWLAASVHDSRGLQQALALPVDFVVIGPVRPTASHPGAPVLGVEGFARLCDQSSIPAYALGGMRPEDLDIVLEAGGQGIAGIRHLGFRSHSSSSETECP